jgi:hypothetical protein
MCGCSEGLSQTHGARGEVVQASAPLPFRLGVMGYGVAAAGALGLLLLCGCGAKQSYPVEDLGGGHDVSRFTLTSIKGTRDGDRLDVRAVYGADTDELKIDLHFTVSPPTRLASGTWIGLAGEGTVRERSVTFLGGQSGPPSVGGRFDLVGRDDTPRYRLTIPLQPLKDPL